VERSVGHRDIEPFHAVYKATFPRLLHTWREFSIYQPPVEDPYSRAFAQAVRDASSSSISGDCTQLRSENERAEVCIKSELNMADKLGHSTAIYLSGTGAAII
jgi:hypothetical protein